MYVNMKYLLDNANRDGYAVMAVNSVNMEMARAVIEAAEELHSPIIVQFGVGQMTKLAHPSEMVPMIKAMAERASVPVCLNLDHGPSLEAVVNAIHWGFSNVMLDASSLPFEENVRRSRMVADLAHAKGISVEAELGHVGQAADGDDNRNDLYTNVEQAKEFVERTGVDALAVAIGTAHGNYPKGYVPVLDFERLAELKAALKMPLVLHGGSGSGEENIRKAVAGGINKINVCTDAFHAAEDAMKAKWEEAPGTDYLNIMMVAEAAIKKFVKDYILLIGSNDRYTFEAADNGSKE
ncbi:MAG: class II fructose-bisphosphate aldolase [Erysipelotrichales bacterium]|nr:class II fructose-bisphosphate aldolase [Erysipelotrichales bacterium]MBQ2309633.1 class II fructose-bisphosphate aldolase [Erysipelotrichales bacterium]MBQ2479413.1 class II fructose-bisphosphate aldolase [Erysipelotrichales bacterium]MBQ4374551.1 class II fructose-bisphosphate aldolase [Erysipelotrichales bacterium]MBQ5541490.1 class II fructose-bisphosphate aldolase [Erysipelotrichales bacterium]